MQDYTERYFWSDRKLSYPVFFRFLHRVLPLLSTRFRRTSNRFHFRRNKLLTRSFYCICCKTFAPFFLLPELKIGIDRKGKPRFSMLRRSSGSHGRRNSKTDVLSGKCTYRERERQKRRRGRISIKERWI